MIRLDIFTKDICAENVNNVAMFEIQPCNMEKWLYQNSADCMECVEGCLLDNFIVATKHGYAAIYEVYKNEWTSAYYVEFQRGIAPEVWARWYKFVDKYETA